MNTACVSPMWRGFIYLITGAAVLIALLMALDLAMVILS